MSIESNITNASAGSQQKVKTEGSDAKLSSAVESPEIVDEHRTDQSSIGIKTDPAERGHRWKKWWETWTPVVNVSIAVIGLLIVALQAVIMHRQSGLMSTQTTIMEHGLRLSERAYVGIASLTANWEAREVVVMLHNVGNVPAKGIKLRALEIRATPYATGAGTGSKEKVYEKLSGSTFLREPGVDLLISKLFPGPPMRVSIPLRGLNQEEIDAILKKQEILYIGGEITYEDGFGNEDSTPFGFEYNPPPNEGWTPHSELSNFFKKNEQ